MMKLSAMTVKQLLDNLVCGNPEGIVEELCKRANSRELTRCYVEEVSANGGEKKKTLWVWPDCPDGEIDDVMNALERLKQKMADRPRDDWRASLAWEAAENARDVFGCRTLDAACLPERPAKFKHWRDNMDTPPFLRK